MKVIFGTSGFRYNHKIIENISYKLGIALVKCSININNRIGVMITASHNQYEDNGIKITDDKGELLSKELEELMTKIVNSDDINYNIEDKVEIIIGQDTRESCNRIKRLIIEGAHSVCKNLSITDLNKVTTPEHHYYLVNTDYKDKYKKIYEKLNINIPVIVDCANGVGYLSLYKILRGSTISLVNTSVNTYNKLNNMCGSDYMMNNIMKNNISFIKPYSLGVSFDGDADRIVCYFIEDNKKYLLDGDHISALILYYLNSILKLKDEISVIHTGYSNGGYIDWVKNKGIETICCPTGVKYLDRVARNKKIGLYFENNGHGTCLINTDLNIPKLNKLKQMFNQVIGDAIGTLASILFILDETNLTLMEWYNLYDKRNYLNDKIKVKDKSIYKTDLLGTTLLEPKDISNKLNNILDENNVRGFIRPSGTEDIIRIYVEGDNDLRSVTKKIKALLN